MVNGVFSIPFPAYSSGGDARSRFASPAAYIAGPENRLAGVAVQAALRGEPARYHPLVLCGPPGSGKSHLARGIAAEWLEQQPESTQLVVTATEFAQEYAQGQHARDLSPLRQRYRTSKLLVLENLAGLAGKAGPQQELAATLDVLADGEGLAIITSRESPQEMTALSAALRSRLSAGLEVKLSLPGPQARLSILEELARARGVNVPTAVCRILADGLKASAAELVGALSALEVAQRTGGQLSETQSIDIAAARQFVALRQARVTVGVRGIAALTAKHFNMKLADLKSPSRQRPVVQARGVAMWLARQLTGSSLGQIGAYFGGRDHTTVLHGCRRIEELLNTDPETREAIGQLRAQLIGP